MAECAIDGCESVLLARGWCGKHYQRWVAHGDPLTMVKLRGHPVEDRFWQKVNKAGPIPELRPDLGNCWVWTGAIVKTYGQFTVTQADRPYAHRYAYELLVGPIPDGLEVDHLCRVRHCVNPGHLEAVTHAENMRRSDSWSAANSRKTHCPQGHPYSEANTILDPRPNGRTARRCRTCYRSR